MLDVAFGIAIEPSEFAHGRVIGLVQHHRPGRFLSGFRKYKAYDSRERTDMLLEPRLRCRIAWIVDVRRRLGVAVVP